MRARVPKFEWYPTPRNGWVCHELQAIVVATEDGWYAHAYRRGVRLGPFTTALEAQLAVEDGSERERAARA